MQFPDVRSMTDEQTATNAAATQVLVPGKFYRFEPVLTASAIPVGGPKVHAVQDLKFERGCYFGFRDGSHVFYGRPVNDPRPITNDFLRTCYFPVLMVGGGSVAVLDPNQSD